MRTIKMNVMSLFWILGLFLVSINSYSQNNILNRKERKEVRKAQMMINFNILDSLLNAKSFVLEADWLHDRYGNRVSVFSTLNFIKVDQSNGILQTGANSGMGYNGVGGVTAEGSIGGWKVYKDAKKMSYSLRFNLITQIGHYDIFMIVTADNYATATITGLGRGDLTWEGHLATVDNSRIFKGQNTI